MSEPTKQTPWYLNHQRLEWSYNMITITTATASPGFGTRAAQLKARFADIAAISAMKSVFSDPDNDNKMVPVTLIVNTQAVTVNLLPETYDMLMSVWTLSVEHELKLPGGKKDGCTFYAPDDKMPWW